MFSKEDLKNRLLTPNIKGVPTQDILKKGIILLLFTFNLIIICIYLIICLGVPEQIQDINYTELITNKHNRIEICKIILSFILSNVDIHELRNLLNSEVNKKKIIWKYSLFINIHFIKLGR